MACGLLWSPLLLGLILLHGATDSLASSGLGLWVPAVQLEAKNPVSTGLYLCDPWLDKSDKAALIKVLKSCCKLPVRSLSIFLLVCCLYTQQQLIFYGLFLWVKINYLKFQKTLLRDLNWS